MDSNEFNQGFRIFEPKPVNRRVGSSGFRINSRRFSPAFGDLAAACPDLSIRERPERLVCAFSTLQFRIKTRTHLPTI